MQTYINRKFSWSKVFPLDDQDDDEVQRRVGRLGPRRKEWEKLGPQQKRKETQHLFDELKKTSETREVEPVQMVGSLLHRLVSFMNWTQI